MRSTAVVLVVIGMALACDSAWARNCSNMEKQGMPVQPEFLGKALDEVAAQLGRGEFEQAERRLNEELEKAPVDSRLWIYDALGAVHNLQKRPADAAQAYRKALAQEDLYPRARYELTLKLASTLLALPDDAGVIALLEGVRRDVCDPLTDQGAYWLASAYTAQGQYLQAEALTRSASPVAPRWLELDWMVQCGLGRSVECVKRFTTLAAYNRITAAQAQWFGKQVASLRKVPEVAPLLQEATDKGWLDAEGRPVANRVAILDDLIPITRVPPEYPARAARLRHEGSVVLLVTVAPDGSVLDAVVKKAQPLGLFDAAAIKAVKTWRFKPKVVDGQPVQSQGIQQIDFKMR